MAYNESDLIKMFGKEKTNKIINSIKGNMNKSKITTEIPLETTEQIILKLPMSISINIAYSGKSIRYKSKEYKEWEQKALIFLLKQIKYNIKGDSWLLVEYDFNFPLFNKNGSKKIKDVGNYEKVVSDFLVKNINGFEDHKIKMLVLKKTDNQEEFINIKIKEIT